MRIVYSSAACGDVKRVLDYYKREGGAKTAGEFVDQLESKVLKILEHPESYRKVAEGRIQDRWAIRDKGDLGSSPQAASRFRA